jgi:hypothetical protein
MQERRRHKRFTADILDMKENMMFARSVKILNISTGGILFKADRRLNIGRHYILNLADKDGHLTLKGIVVCSTLSESRKDPTGNIIPVYTAGMKLTKVSDEKKMLKIINCIIALQK